MLNVIDYMPGTTLLHKLHPVAKVALAAAIIAATFLSNSYAMLSLGCLRLRWPWACMRALRGDWSRL